MQSIVEFIIHHVSALGHIAAGILGISFLIFFHELGHFLFCKLFEVATPSFSIGFGPSLIKKKIGETLFTLSAIPMGGYVEIAGAAEVGQGDQKQAGRKDKYSFARKPYYQKLLIMVGGILFNIIFAYLCMILLFSWGIPKTPLLQSITGTTIVESIPEDSPSRSYLKPNDHIVEINGMVIQDDIHKFLTELRHTEGPATITIVRDHKALTMQIPVVDEGPYKKRLGIVFAAQAVPPHPIKQAIKAGIEATNKLIQQTVNSFKYLFKRKSMDGMGGPLLIISQMVQGSKEGLSIWLIILILISINLAVLNLIPLPIFDGGQILFYTIEAVVGRPLPEKIRIGIHYACWIFIMLFLVFISIKDIGFLLRK